MRRTVLAVAVLIGLAGCGSAAQEPPAETTEAAPSTVTDPASVNACDLIDAALTIAWPDIMTTQPANGPEFTEQSRVVIDMLDRMDPDEGLGGSPAIERLRDEFVAAAADLVSYDALRAPYPQRYGAFLDSVDALSAGCAEVGYDGFDY